jgi:hypothetical protein
VNRLGEGQARFGLSCGGSPLAEIEGIRAARAVTLADRQGGNGRAVMSMQAMLMPVFAQVALTFVLLF